MSGSTVGGKKAAETNKKRYGDNFYATIGRKGGQKTGPKGFSVMSPEARREAGRKGGLLSKRSAKK